jgi:hypothetical protein
MRPLTLLAALLVSCVSPAAASPSTSPAPTSTPTRAAAATCEPTRSHDAAGVITLDGRLGIVGDTSTFGGDMSGGFLLVRSGAVVGDRIALHFDQVGSTAPATWVEYGVTASSRKTPWGDVAFSVGWKPISFSDSCWSLVVDGVKTGIVLAVGH